MGRLRNSTIHHPQITQRALIFLLTSCKKFCVSPIGIFFDTVPAVLQKGEQTFENFTCIWNIETIRSSNLCSRFQSLSETELIKNCRLSSLFKKRTSWYMTRNSWELKLNSTILTHSKSKLMLIVSILMVNLWIWNYNFVPLIFCHLWLSIRCCHFSGSPRVYLQSLNMSLLGHCSHSRCLINFWKFFFF